MDHYCDSLAALKYCKEAAFSSPRKNDLDESIGTVMSSMGRLQNKLGNYEYALELHNAAFGMTSSATSTRSRSNKPKLKFSKGVVFQTQTTWSSEDSTNNESTTSCRWGRRDTLSLIESMACGEQQTDSKPFSFIDCFATEILYLLGCPDDESTVATFDSWRPTREESSSKRENSGTSKKGAKIAELDLDLMSDAAESLARDLWDERDDITGTATSRAQEKDQQLQKRSTPPIATQKNDRTNRHTEASLCEATPKKKIGFELESLHLHG
jgi:hypothetical protein